MISRLPSSGYLSWRPVQFHHTWWPGMRYGRIVMIELLWSIFDITLVLLLLALAWNTCSTRDVMRAVTLFIAMGLLLAIIWARLKAPDLALAEAVIGAGISGALLLSAIRDYPSTAIAVDRSPLMHSIIN